MKPRSITKAYDGVTLRQAALVAGFAYLLFGSQNGVSS
jgi:hypothetical protein